MDGPLTLYVPFSISVVKRNLSNIRLVKLAKYLLSNIRERKPIILKMKYVVGRRCGPYTTNCRAKTRSFRFENVSIGKVKTKQVNALGIFFLSTKNRINIHKNISDPNPSENAA